MVLEQLAISISTATSWTHSRKLSLNWAAAQPGGWFATLLDIVEEPQADESEGASEHTRLGGNL